MPTRRWAPSYIRIPIQVGLCGLNRAPWSGGLNPIGSVRESLRLLSCDRSTLDQGHPYRQPIATIQSGSNPSMGDPGNVAVKEFVVADEKFFWYVLLPRTPGEPPNRRLVFHHLAIISFSSAGIGNR